MKRNEMGPTFSAAKDDVIPFKVNGDASTLPDQHIPTASCESSVTLTQSSRLFSDQIINGAFTRTRWNALRQRMAKEESGAWGSVDTRDIIVRLTGQQTNHATRKLLTL